MARAVAVFCSLLSWAVAIHDDCPDQPDGCMGTAEERSAEAVARARHVNFNQPWAQVRAEVVAACGLRLQSSTSHCFNDFNHVDCCTMSTENTHRTNEESRVVGMHRKNFLGAHIIDASLPEHGLGGSWCTCHLSSPEDVCHKQFGARTAFKLTWCSGSRVAALFDDYGNVLASGKPTSNSDDGSDIPSMGGAPARLQSWQILARSRNQTWAQRWQSSCDRVIYPTATNQGDGRVGDVQTDTHDEL
eukprot:CAMPEP_0115859490 /NCGR_PEP_ID=MMETSP0287-20121206/16642_1 /TAXON_ID=412157 /ORGANISM="Chrysochromulina rotalis, Strain UIO044" /LENGTH=245 /DNA_ID=CAMNT_0003313791 /DNA_START=12 /DNA_END=749 /DNA_ORIENTATION=+